MLLKRGFLWEEGLLQLVSVWPSVQEVPSSIPRHDHKSFFQLLSFRVALNTRKMEHWWAGKMSTALVSGLLVR